MSSSSASSRLDCEMSRYSIRETTQCLRVRNHKEVQISLGFLSTSKEEKKSLLMESHWLPPARSKLSSRAHQIWEVTCPVFKGSKMFLIFKNVLAFQYSCPLLSWLLARRQGASELPTGFALHASSHLTCCHIFRMAYFFG